MKKLILWSLVLLFSNSMFAQEDTSVTNFNSNENNNEVKLNALFLVLGAFDFTYERLLNEESGVGINVFLPYDNDIKDNINYFISPYYRMYFGEKYASGFFLEGFGMLSSVNDTVTVFSTPFDPNPTKIENESTDFALGIGVGGKWITNSGFVGELGFGFGRNITDTADNGDDFVAKIGITIGYRF